MFWRWVEKIGNWSVIGAFCFGVPYWFTLIWLGGSAIGGQIAGDQYLISGKGTLTVVDPWVFYLSLFLGSMTGLSLAVVVTTVILQKLFTK